jgi:site-specific recombinase XerD
MRVIHRVSAILGDSILAGFAKGLGAEGRSEATRRSYQADLGRFRAWIESSRGAGVVLSRIKADDLASYRKHLIETEKLRPASINRKVQALKRFFGWAQQEKIIHSNPAAALQFLRRQERRPPNGLRGEEIQALLRAAGQTGHGLASRNYALLQLLLQTGLRVGEAARLVVADCELNDRSGLVHVRGGADGKERIVPLSTSARRAIALYLQTRAGYSTQDALFLSERGGEAMSLRAMQATIQQLARRAKITRIPVSAHTCRHSFALSFLRRNPCQETELAALLGHDSLDSTTIYLRRLPGGTTPGAEDADE